MGSRQGAGGEARFVAMVDATAVVLLAFALRRAPSAAEDLVAETYEVAWRRRRDFNVEEPLPFLFGVLRNHIRNHHRREQTARSKAVEVEHRSKAYTPDFAPSLIEKHSVLTALSELSEDDQLLLTMLAWDDQPMEVVAATLGLSTGTARVRLHRARKQLRQLISTQRPMKES